MRTDQEGKVENIRETGDGGLTSGDWQGVKLTLRPTFEGELVYLRGTAEVRQPLASAGEQVLESQIADVEARVPNGQTVLFALSEDPRRPRIYTAVTVKLIDPSGSVVAGVPREN
jgi:hypothetical protein